MLDWQIVERLRAKVEWAEKHIRNLQSEWRSFREKGYVIKSKDDPQAGERIWYLHDVWPMPDNIPLITGDAVHNLRSALDHIAYHLVSVFTGGKGPFDNLYFPIGSDRANFENRLNNASEYKSKAAGVVKRLRPDAIKAIKAFEPYSGGKGAILWNLHCLDIADKHHFLLAVGGSNPTHSMSPAAIARYKSGLRMEDEFTPAQEAVLFQTDSLAKFPLNRGDELARVPIAEANEHMNFAIHVAFGKPGVFGGKPIAPTLYQISKFIRDFIRECDSAGLFK